MDTATTPYSPGTWTATFDWRTPNTTTSRPLNCRRPRNRRATVTPPGHDQVNTGGIDRGIRRGHDPDLPTLKLKPQHRLTHGIRHLQHAARKIKKPVERESTRAPASSSKTRTVTSPSSWCTTRTTAAVAPCVTCSSSSDAQLGICLVAPSSVSKSMPQGKRPGRGGRGLLPGWPGEAQSSHATRGTNSLIEPVAVARIPVETRPVPSSKPKAQHRGGR